MKRDRIVVIGGGIAGIATAAELADHFDVTVVEREFQPGYHSTGRSAAVLHLAFENDIVHRLTRIAEPFYRDPPPGFLQLAETIDHIAFDTLENRNLVESFVENWIERCPWLTLLDSNELHARAPLLNKRNVAGALDPRSMRLHVDAILQGYRRLFAEKGGTLLPSRRVVDIDRRASNWRLTIDQSDPIEAEVILNAAGAWADEVAATAGVRPIGLQPRRRTGVIVDPQIDCTNHPMCYRASGGIYFKPEGPLLMVSPADATDSPPCDAQPEELDVAIVIDTLNRCTELDVERPVNTWAGLRSFVPDAQPVIGFDPTDDQFFWVAALGGFGIQTAPAYSKIAASLISSRQGTGLDLVSAHELSPGRFDSNAG
ncbi:MAG: FAD-binding oxidoreductase [Gammaproteobacteria bacterium]|nr:FAD-binding oxidoreductase [Gammaproteobacteria bacterium]